ncbi:endonuclease V [Fervidobacterium sp.]
MMFVLKASKWIAPKTLEEAEHIQNEMFKHLVLCPFDLSNASLIAGVDVSYTNNEALGIVVVINRNFEVVEVISQKTKVSFPYVPGFLAFREAPVILKCFEKLQFKPDLALLDGQGIAHPRKLGIATHIGILLDIPTIGVAKSLLCGRCEKPEKVGQATEIKDKNNDIIGYCYLSKTGTKPIIISPGYKTDLKSSLCIVQALLNGYKLPEPVRLAHYYSQKLKT